MADITELLFDFKNSKSLKIFPKKDRKNLKDINSTGELFARKALNASEKELKYMIDVANRRLERIDSMVKDTVKSGYHLEEEVFIPEYLGFSDVPPENPDDVRVYSRNGYNMARLEEKWVITGPNNLRAQVEIKNMFQAILILGSFGLDVNVKDYMDGAYRDDKPVEDIIVDVQQKVLEQRNTKSIGNENN